MSAGFFCDRDAAGPSTPLSAHPLPAFHPKQTSVTRIRVSGGQPR
jgi:hypothetical protein